MAALLLAVAAAALVVASNAGYVHVPGGLQLHTDCIFELGPNELLTENRVDKCAHKARLSSPDIQIYDVDVKYSPSDKSLVTQMNTSWTVPALPETAGGQVVYFWPGFKSTQPVMGYPVLQPVLQYGQQGAFWMLQSWFVYGNEGIAYTGTAIPVEPGDFITSYMLYDAKDKTWTVYGQNTRTKKDSVLKVTSAKTDNSQFQWAMVVLETIMPEDECGLLPSGAHNVTFTGIKVNNAAVPSWTPETGLKDCNQTIEAVGDYSVVMRWKN